MNLPGTRKKFLRLVWRETRRKQKANKSKKKCWARSVEVISTRNQFIVVGLDWMCCFRVGCYQNWCSFHLIERENAEGSSRYFILIILWFGIFFQRYFSVVSYRNLSIFNISFQVCVYVVQCFFLLCFCCSLAWRKTGKCWMNIAFRLKRRLNEDFYGFEDVTTFYRESLQFVSSLWLSSGKSFSISKLSLRNMVIHGSILGCSLNHWMKIFTVIFF